MTRSGRRKLLTVLVVLLSLLLVGVGAYYILEKKNALEGIYQTRISELTNRIGSSTKEVWRSVCKINAGEILTIDKLEKVQILSDESGFAGDGDIGKVMLIDIPSETCITKTMLDDIQVSDNIREIEYDFVDISSNIMTGDYVDLRILYPDGTDYIIMSKKHVCSLSDTKLVADFNVNEEEILMMDSAVVDAAVYEGTKIYVTKYLKPSVQEASVVNYVPSKETAELIENNPNIVEIASKYLSAELRQRKEYVLEKGKTGENMPYFDDNGLYTGSNDNTDRMSKALFESESVPGSELPDEFGDDLWH